MTTATLPEPPATTPEPRIYEVVDLFCGAGGSSTGAKRAIEKIGGRMRLRAVNHWPVAVETHQLNHPEAEHYIENLETADPEAIVPEGWLDILLASPECRFFSRARGGKPISDQGRMHAWTVHRWLTSLDVRCVAVENVPEFVSWGPLDRDHRPIKSQRGVYFQEWIRSLWGLGYQVEWRMLNSADFGDATTRTRFFLQARKDGIPIEWPERTHSRQGGTGMFGEVPRWKAARDVIDWEDRGRSLLDHPKYLKTPLSVKTRRRIARGLLRHGGELAPLYIQLLDLPEYEGMELPELMEALGLRDRWSPGEPFVLNRHGENGSDRVHSLGEPVPAATGRGAGYLVQTGAEAFVAANRNNNVPRGTDEPVPGLTTATGGGSFLASPGMKSFLLGQQSGGAPRSTGEPAPTIASGGAIALVLPENHPFLLSHQRGTLPRTTDEPVPAVTGRGPGYWVEPTIIQYYGQSSAQDADSPLSTITGFNKHGLVQPSIEECGGNLEIPLEELERSPVVSPALIEVNHGNGSQGDPGNERRVHSPGEPLPSPTSRRGMGLASPIIIQTGQTGGNGSYCRDTGQPVPTLTTKNDMGLVSPAAAPIGGAGEAGEPVPFVVPNFGEREGQEPRCHGVDEPVPSVTGRGAGNLVTPGLGEALQQLEASGTDPRRLVVVDGHPYLLDIRFRMLKNVELARAMGFSDEETKYEFRGNTTEVTKQIGNAVAVGTAAALVGAALGPVARAENGMESGTEEAA